VKSRPPLARGPHLVVGLARSGQAAAILLAARGEEVVGVDAGTPDTTALLAQGIEVHTGSDGVALLERVRNVVKSPGVPSDAAVIVAARERGLRIMGELELAWRLLGNEFIAVTGTNGKTTTVELIGHLHREAGLPVAVAGNVGTALSTLVGRVAPATTIVCEASSFQLEDALEFAPEAAVLLNITPDHLDRHGEMDAYRAAKFSLFSHQGNDDLAVVPMSMSDIDVGGCARRVSFGAEPGADLNARNGELWWLEQPLIALTELRIPGAHNAANAMAGAAACQARGMDVDAVRGGLRSFTGVAHRLQQVAQRAGVVYVDDSKATNVASTLVALAAFPPSSIHVILGGRGKGQDFAPLREAVASACRAVYLIGEDAGAIELALRGAGPPLSMCGELERAVREARDAARSGEVVLLAPACASYDQFADFEARGDRFSELAAGP
jgi:UDP-N-acetylmuramoylalanine--D-glutamate ligase